MERRHRYDTTRFKIRGDMACEVVPRVLVINCGQKSPSILASEILRHSKCEDYEPSQIVNERTVSYKWRIDNKYYTADVKIYATDDVQCNGDICENVEAVVIEIDAEESSSSKLKNYVKSLLELCEPSVRLVAFSNFQDDDQQNSIGSDVSIDLQQWCLENNFELVEMSEVKTSDEVDGIVRLIDALHAHMWSNLEMKDSSTAKLLQSHKSPWELSEDGANTEAIDSILLERISHDDDGACNFEDIFCNLKDMKEKASQLSFEDRKLYAEKMAVAFWNAMGGDEDEIAGIFPDQGNSPTGDSD